MLFIFYVTGMLGKKTDVTFNFMSQVCPKNKIRWFNFSNSFYALVITLEPTHSNVITDNGISLHYLSTACGYSKEHTWTRCGKHERELKQIAKNKITVHIIRIRNCVRSSNGVGNVSQFNKSDTAYGEIMRVLWRLFCDLMALEWHCYQTMSGTCCPLVSGSNDCGKTTNSVRIVVTVSLLFDRETIGHLGLVDFD